MTGPSTDPLLSLDADRCEALIGTIFSGRFGERSVELRLVAVLRPAVDEFHLEARRRGGIRLQPFNLHFRGPGDARLTQGVLHLEHTALGDLEMFLVPIGADADGPLYEAVFN